MKTYILQMRPDAISLPPMNYDFYYRYHIINIQGYLQRMRLRWESNVRTLYCLVSYIYTIPCNFKLFSFLSKSFSKPLKGSIRAEDFFSSYFNDLKSSLQSNPLWVTLYIGVYTYQMCNFARGYFPSGNFPNDNVPNGNFPIVNFPNYQFPK